MVLIAEVCSHSVLQGLICCEAVEILRLSNHHHPARMSQPGEQPSRTGFWARDSPAEPASAIDLHTAVISGRCLYRLALSTLSTLQSSPAYHSRPHSSSAVLCIRDSIAAHGRSKTQMRARR